MRGWICYILFLCTVSLGAQQQSLYTQFMYNKQIFNPAYTAVEESAMLGAVYRSQWVGLEGAPTSIGLSYNHPIASQNASMGFNLRRNSIGLSKEIILDGLYAYKFIIGPGKLHLGLQLSIKNYAINFNGSDVNTTSEVGADPALQGPMASQNFNFGLGAYYRLDNFYLGLSVPRFQNIDLDKNDSFNFSKEQRHVFLMLGGNIDISEDLDLRPQLLYKWLEVGPSDIDINMSVVYNDKYTAGLTFRAGGDSDSFGESIDLIFSMQINEKILAGFAYDYTLSKIRKRTNGSLELICHYNFGASSPTEPYVNPRYF